MDSLTQGAFWLSQLTEVVALAAVAWGAGILATRHDVRVNYTRKIVHFSAFFLPVLVTDRFPFDPSPATTVMSGIILLALLGLLVEPIRRRSSFLTTVFRSFDRPEDRPHTLRWLTTQLAAGYAVIIAFGAIFSGMDMLHLIYIPIVVSGIGDGLAEPVGVRFGRREYEVPAWGTDRTYVRTLEGSACVFLTAVVVLLVFRGSFTTTQLLVGLATIPALMTLAEARAPHTWDQPFLMLTGSLSILAILAWV